MNVDTQFKVWVFSLATTFLALILAEGLNLLVFTPEYWPVTMPGTAIIVLGVTIPITYYVGLTMLENAQLNNKLQALVDRDRLTDVATRDFFFNRLALNPKGYGVSLMIDIDHFKSVNDTFGHLVGDTVIVAVAEVLQQTVRETDIVCRFGGEEFVVFLSKADEVEGARIAERIRADVENRVTATEAGDVRVTVSVGGSLKARLEHIEEAIKRADHALYIAKSRGRNRAILDWELSHAA